MSRPHYKSIREYVNAQPRTKRQAEIAADLGLNASSLAAYMGGHRVPSRETALRLAQDFNISLEGLLDPSTADERASA
jgi:transcriptional regulator with XRE-family HTH domain